MASNDALQGQGDFGLAPPSNSNSVGQPQGGDLASLLGNNMLDEAGKSRLLTQQLQQAQSGEGSQSFLQRLLSPQGILPLLLGGGAALAGQPALGAGIGLGGLQGITQSQEVERTQRAKAIEELQTQLDKSEDRQDKSRQRFTSLFQAQPELFLTKEGESTIDARVLGWYATGAPVPIYPGTKRILDLRDEQWAAQQKFMFKALEGAKSIEESRVLTRALFNHHGMSDPPGDLLESTLRSFGKPEFDQNMANNFFKYGGPSGLDAMIWAGENDLPLTDPRVLARVEFKDPTVDTPSQVLNSRFLSLMDEVNAWEQNPENIQQALKLRADAGSDIDEATRLISARALEGRQNDLSFLMNRNNVPPGLSLSTMFQGYGVINSKYEMGDAVRGVGDATRQRGLTDEQLQQEKGVNTLRLIEDTQKYIDQTQANRDAKLRNDAAITIQESIAGLGVSSIYDGVNQIFNEALAATPRDASGQIDRAQFEAIIAIFTKAYIKQNKAQE